jgi:hypothetical protein
MKHETFGDIVSMLALRFRFVERQSYLCSYLPRPEGVLSGLLIFSTCI